MVRRATLWTAIVLFGGLAILALTAAGSPAARGQATETPTRPPTVTIPGSVEIAPGAAVTFAPPPPTPTPTLAPGQPPTPNPAGCGPCLHSLSVKNLSSDAVTATFDGTRFTVTGPDNDALRLVTGRPSYGSQITTCASVNRQLNALSCTLALRPPIPSLDISVSTIPVDSVGDQTLQLPSIFGGTAVLVGDVPPPAPNSGTLAPVPVLLVNASGGQQATLHWDGGSRLTVETPLATTAQVSGEMAEYQPATDIDCSELGGSNHVTCPLPLPLPISVLIDVVLPAGWNLIAAPNYTASPYTGTLYGLQPGANDYTAVAAGDPLALNGGYWLYLATPAPIRPIATTITSVPPLVVPDDAPALIGNNLSLPARIEGATAIYRYDPAIGYIPVDTLPPGAGAVVYSANGSVTLVPITPTPTP